MIAIEIPERKLKAWSTVNKTFSPEVTINQLFVNEFGSLDDRKRSLPHLIWIQCTGLPDRKGKIIWEGDILEQEIQNEFGSIQKFVGVMEFVRSTGAFMGRYDAPHMAPAGVQKAPLVLGNIFETPEKLPDNKK